MIRHAMQCKLVSLYLAFPQVIPELIMVNLTPSPQRPPNRLLDVFHPPRRRRIRRHVGPGIPRSDCQRMDTCSTVTRFARMASQGEDRACGGQEPGGGGFSHLL